LKVNHDTLLLSVAIILNPRRYIKVYLESRSIEHAGVGIVFGFPLLFLPILISVLVGISNRLQYGLKSKVGRCSAA